jgi:Leucine-rich repeat (LRR) protein
MASDKEARLVEALFTYDKANILDNATKAALRLCNKHFKSLVDAVVPVATVYSDNLRHDLKALIKTEWYGLQKLYIMQMGSLNPLKKLLSALFVKFPQLENLQIIDCKSLKALPTKMRKLKCLKTLEISGFKSLTALPDFLGRMTTLENITLSKCRNLTPEGLAPLQHLTGLTSLWLCLYGQVTKYPDVICNLTSLKQLVLVSPSTKTLPDALGNLTNLEVLEILLWKLEELPESIGKLNALKVMEVKYSNKLTTLPESLDDLLWRKAHETEESKKMELVDFHDCYKLVFSTKMKQALKLMKQNGTDVLLPGGRPF